MKNATRIAVLLALGALLGAAAPPAADRLAKFTVQGEAAKKLLEKSQINVATARGIVDGCLAFARARGTTVTVAIYDQFGVPVLIHRMDGQGRFDVESAMLKARTVLNTRAPTHLLLNDVLTGDTTEFHQEHFHRNYADKGGLPIRVDDQFLGAIGVGGSAVDEECARAGLEAVLGPQPALTPNVAPRPQPANR
jgi:glc operon protein GlcG